MQNLSFNQVILDVIASMDGHNVRVIENEINPEIATSIIIASFTSGRQVIFAKDKIRRAAKDNNISLFNCSRKRSIDTEWVALKCADTLVHLFHDEVREYYKLDEFYSKNDKELKCAIDNEESNETSVEGSRKIRTELSKNEFLKELFGDDYTSDNNKINIEDLKLIHKGKVKSIYAHPENEDLIVQYYSDDVTAFNKDRYHFDGKGSVNCAISTKIMEYLNDCGVKTHFKECLDDGVTQVCTALKILPLEVTVRNYAFGGVLKRSHFQSGQKLETPLLEFIYKNDDMGDPLISESYVFNYIFNKNAELMDEIKKMTLDINDLLIKFFDKIDITLADFKIEFGLDKEGILMLADEISPDTCRLMDKLNNNAPLDKDVLRRQLGDVMTAYKEVLRRLEHSCA